MQKFNIKKILLMKNHPANAGGISVPSKLRLPIRLKVGLEFAFHRLTPVVCAFDVIKTVILSVMFVVNQGFAQTTTCAEDEILGVTTKKCIKASGTCGTNCNYTIDASGNLKILGDGQGIVDQTFRRNKDIVNVDIKGIQTITGQAFFDAGTGGGTVTIDDSLKSLNKDSFWHTGFKMFDIDSTDFSTSLGSFNTENITLSIYPNLKNFVVSTFSLSNWKAIDNLTIQCKGDITLCAKNLSSAIQTIINDDGKINMSDSNGNYALWDKEGYTILDADGRMNFKYDYSSNLLSEYAYNSDGSVTVYNKNGKIIGFLGKRIYTIEEAEKLSKPNGNTIRLRYK